MKKVLIIIALLATLAFTSCGTAYLSNGGDIQRELNGEFRDLCTTCFDPILISLEQKVNQDPTSLNADEKQLYATLKQNCEICKASHRVAYQINDKPNASTPLWFVIISSVVAGIILNNGMK